jgi:hypothetical protein
LPFKCLHNPTNLLHTALLDILSLHRQPIPTKHYLCCTIKRLHNPTNLLHTTPEPLQIS